MGHNVQSQAGVSIADVYDVKGSQAPIERVLTTEVAAVHEMGQTIFSERSSGVIRRMSEEAAQNINLGVEISDLPGGAFMLHGVQVLTDDVSRLTRVAVYARTRLPAGGERDFPIWVWDGVNSITVRIIDNGASSANIPLLQPEPAFNTLPQLMLGSDQPQAIDTITMRGTTSGFGAGTVEVIVLMRISFAAIGGISALGLPVPSW